MVACEIAIITADKCSKENLTMKWLATFFLTLPATGWTQEATLEDILSYVRPLSDTYSYVMVLRGPHGESQLPLSGDKPTHVMIAGEGYRQATMFQEAATAHAHKIREQNPDHQILLLAPNEMSGDLNERLLSQWGWEVSSRKQDDLLRVQDILLAVMNVQSIETLHIYGHANPHGTSLGGEFLSTDSVELQQLTPKFTSPVAYATVNGCNAGYSLSPTLARWWGIPVGGAYTGTHFEYLHSTNRFYWAEDRLAPPGPWASINSISFAQPLACAQGACLRMRPDNAPYRGGWGPRDHGLGFQRFSCGTLSPEQCETRMAHALIKFVSVVNTPPTPEQFMSLIVDFMCPIHPRRPLREECAAGIARDLRLNRNTFSPFLGPALQCYSDDSCVAPEPGQRSTTFMDQVRMFLRGYPVPFAEAARPQFVNQH